MPDALFHKLGLQSPDDPMQFVMSTADPDRHGDIVDQSWILANFRKNPIALFGHDSRIPIGTWERVRVEAGRLVGHLKLAAAGTSARIDEIRGLVEQRILRAVSVGFMPGTRAPLDPEHPWDGMRLSQNELYECSLVAVPANAGALQLAFESLNGSARALLRGALATDPPSAAEQLRSFPSRASGKRNSPFTKGQPMKNLADKITARRAELTQLRTTLDGLIADGTADDGTMDESTDLQINEIKDQIALADRALATLLDAERALAEKARPATGAGAAGGAGDGGELMPRIEMRRTQAKGHRAIAAMACMIVGHHEKRHALDIAQRAYGDHREIEVIVRAATAPATMTDPAWAAPLVRETWGEFIDLIRDIAVYPAVPGLRVDFDRYGKIVMPRNDGRGKLAGGFVQEGMPIPVKSGVLGSVDMSPRKMAVISTFTKEIGRHSIPAIEELIRAQILGDTAEALDFAFLSNAARTVVRPAGLQDITETGAPNIVASAGATVGNILTDITGVLGRAMTARAATGGAWIMNPLRALGLSMKQDPASGQFVFRAEVAGGNLSGYSIIQSENVPTDRVYFVGGRAMAFGNDYAPSFDVSEETTLHMEDTDPDPIVEGPPGAPVVATPVRSMFQTDSVAIKMTMGLDWRITRIGGVQVLTGVAW